MKREFREYQKKKDELYAEYSLEIDTMAKLNDELETLEKQRTAISNEEYEKRRKDISARYQETIKVYGEFHKKMNQLDIQRIGISDEEYEKEKEYNHYSCPQKLIFFFVFLAINSFASVSSKSSSLSIL